jgi:hypothetical protein
MRPTENKGTSRAATATNPAQATVNPHVFVACRKARKRLFVAEAVWPENDKVMRVKVVPRSRNKTVASDTA